ncbi:hypothetical protein PIROE2DRAFT_18095 [Piromyces sp. E2]|nr:hypothetical protein PIROE2DRAFT_18095 [Piromyces sp. E2]|eukprot:OUM57042.1 hypothetical protein PIROE2DRAFT_18095 [Piromyces sp. E2]
MSSTQNENENDISNLSSDIIRENQTKLVYLSQQYCLTIKLTEDKEEKENWLERFIYEKVMSYEDFEKLGKLFKLHDTIEEVYNFVLALMEKKNMIIEEIIQDDSLVLSMEEKFTGYDNPFTAKIELMKKERDSDTLIDILYKEVERKNQYIESIVKEMNSKGENYEEKIKLLEEENNFLKEENNSLKEENNFLKEEKNSLKEENNSLKEEKVHLEDEINENSKIGIGDLKLSTFYYNQLVKSTFGSVINYVIKSDSNTKFILVNDYYHYSRQISSGGYTVKGFDCKVHIIRAYYDVILYHYGNNLYKLIWYMGTIDDQEINSVKNPYKITLTPGSYYLTGLYINNKNDDSTGYSWGIFNLKNVSDKCLDGAYFYGNIINDLNNNTEINDIDK